MNTKDVEQLLEALRRSARAQTVAVTLSVPGLDYTVRLVFDGGSVAAYQHREFAEALGAAYDAQVGSGRWASRRCLALNEVFQHSDSPVHFNRS